MLHLYICLLQFGHTRQSLGSHGYAFCDAYHCLNTRYIRVYQT